MKFKEVPATPLNKEDILFSVKLLTETVLNARESTEKEFLNHKAELARGKEKFGSSWLACVTTPVSTVTQCVQILNSEGVIPNDEYASLTKDLRDLVSDIKALIPKFPTLEDVVPDDIKEGLFSKFEKIGGDVFECLRKNGIEVVR